MAFLPMLLSVVSLSGCVHVGWERSTGIQGTSDDWWFPSPLSSFTDRSVFENMALGQKGRKKGEIKEEEIGPHYMQK